MLDGLGGHARLVLVLGIDAPGAGPAALHEMTATQVVGDEKLVLLAAFLALSAVLAVVIARTFSEPLNRSLRSSLGAARAIATA